MTRPNKLVLSIIVPLKNEVGNLRFLMEELSAAMESIHEPWEVVFVDDGSDDGSWEVIETLNGEYPNVRGLRFTRNYGHQIALRAGLEAARGQAVVSMDADLQHPPSLIPELVARWRNGFEIVHTHRIDRQNVLLVKRLTARWFYRLFSYLSGVTIQDGAADFRLIDRRVVHSVLRYKDQHPFYRAIVRNVGYKQTTVDFETVDRYSGSTKYRLRQMLSFAWSGICSFSSIPLRLSIYMGLVTSLLAFSGVVYAVYSWLVLKSTVPGWTSLVSIISFLIGVQFIMLGMLGEYIGRILREVTRRPRYLIDETLEATNESLQEVAQARLSESGARNLNSGVN